MAASIPSFVVEYFLLGRTRRDAIERYTQDGGIVTDVWLAFARDIDAYQRVLVAPSVGCSAIDLGFSLHRAITDYRLMWPANVPRDPAGVSPLENFVAVTLNFDELVRIVFPLTSWWHRKNLGALQRTANLSARKLDDMLERAIKIKLGHEEEELNFRADAAAADVYPDRRILEAAPLAALIGVFYAARGNAHLFDTIAPEDPTRELQEGEFVMWVQNNAELIASEARKELARQYETALVALRDKMRTENQVGQIAPEDPPEMIQRVFLDREATLATDDDALCTIKSDAAYRVFDISCRNIIWAIIDSGIANTHPAFLDHNARDRLGNPIIPVPPHRIKATYDFTRIQLIRNFDLTLDPDGTPGRQAAIDAVVAELATLPGRVDTPQWRTDATNNLAVIARQLEQRIPPDWGLIQSLIRLGDWDDGSQLVSDHGTHVAGILGADWRDPDPAPNAKPDVLLRGVCPDIGLYDLRVIHPVSRRSSEFALLAALEFIQFVNARAGTNGPVVHGVNVSLSIPHDVRNYGCGATPVCVACDRLVASGVVVVAAAGNRGWNEQEVGFGNFVFCSITDPGNSQNVITVGSTHGLRPHSFGISYFSSRGPTGDGRVKPDLVAPGEQIRGPIRGGADDELDGTSMAAPFVSGAAAMLLARHRELIGNPIRVKEILCDSATDLGRERYFQGHGLVDVLRALQAV
jgi:serine protease AprX